MPVLDHILAAAAALTLAAAATAVVERLARRWDVVDRPADHKHHRHATPLLGGVAIFAAVAAAAALWAPLTGRDAWGLAVAAGLVFAAGLYDDLRGLSVTEKLAAQVAATTVLFLAGWGIDLPFVGGAVTLVWVVGIVNALNLLDNMDGAATGVTAVAATFFALLLGPDPAALVAGMVAGASAGFLIFNFPRARIFMGDAGSLFLGLMLAASALRVVGQDGAHASLNSVVAAVLVLGVPIFDTTLVTVSRLRRGKNPMTTPGKDHLTHRLLRLGWSERATVGALCGLGAVLGALALVAHASATVVAAVLGLAVLAAAVAALRWLDG